jgi:hypothetical protein
MVVSSNGKTKVAGGQFRQIGWVGDDCHIIFNEKFPAENSVL